MSRLPIRWRLTLAFALASALVLVAVGALVYVRLGDSLLESLDDGLESRAAAVSSLEGPVESSDDDGFARFVREGDSGAPLLSEAELARAQTGRFFTSRDSVAVLGGEPARLLVTSTDRGVLVVGGTLEDREEALDGLLAQLLLVGPLALALTSLAGYLLAASALRPVEAMRRRAAEVSTERSGQRLPLPAARDELRRLGETLNVMLERLEEGIARERRFVADASHELRTPLSLLRTELELALRRPRSAEELEAALRSAGDEVERLGRLADDLLVLSQLEDGRMPLRVEAVEPRELLDTVARRFAARATAAGRALEVHADDDAELFGDPLRLEQALGNLVDNALRHGAGAVRLEAQRVDGGVELRVEDEGSGLPPAYLPHAFERFTRADESRARGGAGLGLAIVAAIARAHGGAAQADGAVVRLRLPSAAFLG